MALSALPPLLVPTPVRRLDVDTVHELWLKDDSSICSVYGGNKPRKLAHLLEAALRRGARRVVTCGAIGSHHVLATGLLARRIGLSTMAIAFPRPYSEDAERTALDALRADVELVPLAAPSDASHLLTRVARRGDFYIAPGGSSPIGALGHLEAVEELKLQVAQRELPEPDLIVVALGSGGTAAGILAGLACTGLRSRLVAVPVLHLPMPGALVRVLATAAARLRNRRSLPDFSSRLVIDSRWVGQGYGYPIAAGELALQTAAGAGLTLEATYTAKSFACALDWSRGQGPGRKAPGKEERLRILYWSTYSAVSLATPLASAVTLPAALARLFQPNTSQNC